MKLTRIFLACTLLPACAATPLEQTPGMPLDRELLRGKPEEALTAAP